MNVAVVGARVPRGSARPTQSAHHAHTQSHSPSAPSDATERPDGEQVTLTPGTERTRTRAHARRPKSIATVDPWSQQLCRNRSQLARVRHAKTEPGWRGQLDAGDRRGALRDVNYSLFGRVFRPLRRSLVGAAIGRNMPSPRPFNPRRDCLTAAAGKSVGSRQTSRTKTAGRKRSGRRLPPGRRLSGASPVAASLDADRKVTVAGAVTRGWSGSWARAPSGMRMRLGDAPSCSLSADDDDDGGANGR